MFRQHSEFDYDEEAKLIRKDITEVYSNPRAGNSLQKMSSASVTRLQTTAQREKVKSTGYGDRASGS